MKLNPGRAYESSVTPRATSYDVLAREYYDEIRHPTCADFRSASRIYLTELFSSKRPRGRIADIGCGRSLLAEFDKRNVVLIDSSSDMLAANSGTNEKYLIDVEAESFGNSEFDWVFAILGDPFNSLETWKHIRHALKPAGNCVFMVPSFGWASAFRSNDIHEKEGFAAFAIADGTEVYVRSTILSVDQQKEVIREAGLTPVRVDHVNVSALGNVRSAKISNVLSREEAILDIYCAARNS